MLGATPATIAGALLSPPIGGSKLLIASGFVLTIVGVRVLRPIAETLQASGTMRRKNRILLVTGSAGVGLFSGSSPTAEASFWSRCTCAFSASTCAMQPERAF
jgi:uncharacterized membrane protein YfcA